MYTKVMVMVFIKWREESDCYPERMHKMHTEHDSHLNIAYLIIENAKSHQMEDSLKDNVQHVIHYFELWSRWS